MIVECTEAHQREELCHFTFRTAVADGDVSVSEFAFMAPFPLGFEPGQQFEFVLIPLDADPAADASPAGDQAAPAGPPRGAVLVERVGLVAMIFTTLHALLLQLVGGPVDVDG